jgi:hypothetical protein
MIRRSCGTWVLLGASRPKAFYDQNNSQSFPVDDFFRRGRFVDSQSRSGRASITLCSKTLAGDISVKIDMKKSIPNLIVYAVLYAALFGICIWLLVFHNESPTNWVLYIGMAMSVLAGLVKFALHSRKRYP